MERKCVLMLPGLRVLARSSANARKDARAPGAGSDDGIASGGNMISRRPQQWVFFVDAKSLPPAYHSGRSLEGTREVKSPAWGMFISSSLTMRLRFAR